MKNLSKMGKVQRRLRAQFRGGREMKLSDVLNAIRAEGLPPFKTRDKMLELGMLNFVGKHSRDQRYTLPVLHRHKWVEQGDRLVCRCGFYLSNEKPDPGVQELRNLLGMDAGPPAELPSAPPEES